MSYSLYLDDIRSPKTKAPKGEWKICRSYGEAIDFIELTYFPSHISFDHDLGEGKTGYDFAKYIVESDLTCHGTYLPSDFSFHVHSANIVGKKNIEGLLNNYLKCKHS